MKTNTAVVNTPTSNQSNTKDSIQTISGRQSKELIIAFCGAIGAGVKEVKKEAREVLEELGYEIVDIRLSKLMDQFSSPPGNIDAAKRYEHYQDLGDNLRNKFEHQILAEAAIREITVNRREVKDRLKKQGYDEKTAALKIDQRKVAYLLDQLKNPAEVELLRLVYANNFYLIGLIRSEEERRRNLISENIDSRQADNLIHRDRKTEEKHGQQTEKTILDSDVFIHNSQNNITHLKNTFVRFFNLIHGKNGITPTKHEKGMFAAFSASLQSACLSRQVGAAILDENGHIISTGRNDVPKAYGGLYSADDGQNDHRCIRKGGKCYNDDRKLSIKKQIEQLLISENIKEKDAKDISSRIYKEAKISSLLEFSRSIHAEMDAITTIARTGIGLTQGATLYTTTYPCHNCARHIVAAGITKAIFIEPYEKSLALDLHDDAITNHADSTKVIFEAFEGVSPRRYAKFFFASDDRKNEKGEAKTITAKYRNHVDIQFLDSYSNYETKIADEFSTRLNMNVGE